MENNPFNIKTLDKKTLSRLNWLLIPLGIVLAIILCDLIFELGMGSETWAKYAMAGGIALYMTGFTICCIRKKCWIQWITYFYGPQNEACKVEWVV